MHRCLTVLARMVVMTSSLAVASIADARPEFANGEGAADKPIASIASLVDGLKQRLQKEPGDVKGWVLLAKSYHHIGDWHEAAKAAAKARELGYSGEILPDEKSIVPKGHHGHGYKGVDAGKYVESFFNSDSTDSAPVKEQD